MIKKSTLTFLRQLKKNNNKPWFDVHRADYEAARADFLNFVDEIIGRHSRLDPSIKNISGRDCIFRINRDVRFSKDKSPYKTNFGASINCRGRKAWDYAGYYFHLEPGASFAGGGIYMPPPQVLRQVRQEIDYNFTAFQKLLSNKKFKSFFGGLDRSAEFSLTRVPKGYEPGNPAAEYLKLKSYLAMTPVSDAELTSGRGVQKAVAAFAALYPVVTFINEAVSQP
ncbi:MAG TPA: DUF2461 domain-containing protein [Chitinophagaceae bacterium]|nr:DUF2461 domain-containing protein [Chitinophagaceae bacterium]